MLHTFTVHVDDSPGVLNRVASMLRRRAFRAESLTLGPTETPGVSRMTMVVETDAYGARRLEANLYKLVPVRQVDDITAAPSITRDLALIKVAVAAHTRAPLLQLVEIYRARIVDASAASMVVEATGTAGEIDCLVEALQHYGVIETARTGRIAMACGSIPPRPQPLPPPALVPAELDRDVSSCSV